MADAKGFGFEAEPMRTGDAADTLDSYTIATRRIPGIEACESPSDGESGWAGAGVQCFFGEGGIRQLSQRVETR